MEKSLEDVQIRELNIEQIIPIIVNHIFWRCHVAAKCGPIKIYTVSNPDSLTHQKTAVKGSGLRGDIGIEIVLRLVALNIFINTGGRFTLKHYILH